MMNLIPLSARVIQVDDANDTSVSLPLVPAHLADTIPAPPPTETDGVLTAPVIPRAPAAPALTAPSEES